MIIIPKGPKLKLHRMKKGYSLRGLSQKTGVHYSTIFNIENGKGSVNPKTAKLICEGLKIDFDEFFDIVNESFSSNKKEIKE